MSERIPGHGRGDDLPWHEARELRHAAREASAPYRDPQTEQAIADARADARARPLRDDPHSDEADMARNAEGPFDDKPDVYADIPSPRAVEGVFGHGVTAKDHACTVLRGESHDAFAEFTAAAQALEAHQRAAAPVLERYKVALGKLSAIAARGAP